MALKTLDPATKAAFSAAGVNLTPTQEHLAATASWNWQALIADLAKYAPMMIQILLGLLGDINPPPNPPAPAKTASGKSCDHYACACAVLASSLETTKLAAEHACKCCDGAYGS